MLLRFGATHNGWKSDVFHLYTPLKTSSGKVVQPLFEKIYPAQLNYVAKRDTQTTERARLLALDE